MDPRKDTAHKAVVIGAGPVGCLTAMSLAKMGWQVDVFEARPGGYTLGRITPSVTCFLLSSPRYATAGLQGCSPAEIHQPCHILPRHCSTTSRRFSCCSPLFEDRHSHARSNDTRYTWYSAQPTVRPGWPGKSAFLTRKLFLDVL